MAKTIDRPKVKLIVGIMFGKDDVIGKVEDILVDKFGPVENIILTYPFSFTDYYEKETGKNLRKTLIAFKKLISRDALADIKAFTNKLEDRFAGKGKRKVNIDPGYLTMHNVVLASAKEMPHRVSIGKGMFADVVLTFRDNEYHDSETTFPDYKMGAVKEFLASIRKTYSKQLQKQKS